MYVVSKVREEGGVRQILRYAESMADEKWLRTSGGILSSKSALRGIYIHHFVCEHGLC